MSLFVGVTTSKRLLHAWRTRRVSVTAGYAGGEIAIRTQSNEMVLHVCWLTRWILLFLRSTKQNSSGYLKNVKTEERNYVCDERTAQSLYKTVKYTMNI